MIIVLVGGAIVLGAMIMDTTVASGFDGKRYYNSGLQQVQMMGLLIGLTVGLIGIAVAIVYWPKQGLYLSSKLLREVLGALNVLGGGASSIGTGASEDSSSPKIKGN